MYSHSFLQDAEIEVADEYSEGTSKKPEPVQVVGSHLLQGLVFCRCGLNFNLNCFHSVDPLSHGQVRLRSLNLRGAFDLFLPAVSCCKLSSLSFVFLSEMSTRVPDADWLTAFPLSLIGRRLRHESRCVSTHPYSCLHLDVTKNTFHKSGEVTQGHARRNRDGVVRVGQ